MPDLFSMLAAAGPYAGIDENRQLYAPLIGSWEVDATWHEPDGSSREARGEWRRALDGGSLDRWTFSEIARERFLWRGESSRDDGLTWRLDQEMRGARLTQ